MMVVCSPCSDPAAPPLGTIPDEARATTEECISHYPPSRGPEGYYRGLVAYAAASRPRLCCSPGPASSGNFFFPLCAPHRHSGPDIWAGGLPINTG